LFYSGFNAQKKLQYSVHNTSDLKAEDITIKEKGTEFNIGQSRFTLNLNGEFNVYNALPAILVGRLFGLSDGQIASGLALLGVIAGRMEEVETGKGFRAFVDYAHEPAGLQSVLESANKLKQHGKSIVLLGAAGGGRDKARRPIMGKVAGTFADMVIVSDDEPYEEDSKTILDAVTTGVLEAGKIEGENLFVISDRREGIKKALQMAKKGDVVVFTGLGHQKVRMIGKEAIPWVEKEVVKEELLKV
jgi:UDP-N-acetylmuramoyl-L-alanyl-D-glutamate--2,6-diaminopimelate ligase